MEESNPDSLISHKNQSLMTASDDMELDGFSYGIKTPEELKAKGFESILHSIPALNGMGCCMLHAKHLDCFDEGHPPNSHKRGLVDEIINFYIFWMGVFRYFSVLTLSTNLCTCHFHLLLVFI